MNFVPLKRLIWEKERILLLIHAEPDGDAVASAVSLYWALKYLGKPTWMVCRDPVPEPFLFLEGTGLVQGDFLLGDHDLVIILDCGDLKRTGFPERLMRFSGLGRGILVNLDHHPKSDLHKIADLNLVDYQAASVSQLIWQLCLELNVPVNKIIATALLMGVYTDTGGFKHSNTTPEVLSIAAKLLSRGARLAEIAKNVAIAKSVSALKLWGVALSRIRRDPQSGLVSSVITQEDLEKTGASEEDIAGLVNLIVAVPGARAAMLLSERSDGTLKASLRTEESDVDVSQLASFFGGGGHRKASGFSLTAKLISDGNGGWKLKESQ